MADGSVVLIEQHSSLRFPERSGGESRFAALDSAFAEGSDVLLFDEPTNDLDAVAKSEYMRKLAEFKDGVVIIASHDPELLDRVDEIWELRNGMLSRHPPGFAAYMERVRLEELRLREKIDHLEQEDRKGKARARQLIERQEKRSERGRKNGVRQNIPKIVRGAKKRQAEQTLAKVLGTQENLAENRNREIRETKSRLRQLTFFDWNGYGTRPPNGKRMVRIRGGRLRNFVRSLDLDLIGAQRIHLRGRNGSGKSTLLQALAGHSESLDRVEGTFFAATPFEFFDQRLGQFTAEEPLWEWFRRRVEKDVAEARSILGRLGFEQEEQTRPVKALSGGERMRIELALALHQPKSPQLLLLDEPSNHLDPESRKILDQFLAEFQGALVLVSHDQRLVDSLHFDQVIDLDDYLKP